jgi:Ca-activated chloride channel homolog
MIRWITYLLFPMMVLPAASAAQSADLPQVTRILFLLDASQSMNEGWGGRTRFEIATRIITETVDSLSKVPNVQMALRVFGHQYYYTANNCKDTRLEVGFRPNSAAQIKLKLREIRAQGITPIAYSLERIEGDFPPLANSRNIVILITDGEESCKGDPCKVSLALQSRNIILKPFVVGLGYQSELKTNLDCIGSYFEANTVQEFSNVMTQIIRRILDRTTVEVQLMDHTGNPTETDINLSFINTVTGLAQYNYYHTLTPRGRPDTMNIDPINNYHLLVHTIPPIVKRNIELVPNTHNVLKISAPQGQLNLVMKNSTPRYNANIQCLIRQKDRPRTIHIQAMNSSQRYLTGTYDITILTLPRIEMENLEIQPNEISTLQIPEPGLVNINSTVEIYGGIFRMQGREVEKVYQLNDRILKESILLQPGNYTLVYRHKINRRSMESVTRNFTIRSGESINLNL